MRHDTEDHPLLLVRRAAVAGACAEVHRELNLQGQISQIAGVTIYPPEYFCPLSYVTGQLVITENTRSIHHFNASWVSKESRKIMEIKKCVAGKGRIAHIAASVQIRLLVFADVAKKRGIGKVVSMTFQYIGKKTRNSSG